MRPVCRSGTILSKCAMPRRLHTSLAFSSHSTPSWAESPVNSGIKLVPSRSPPLHSIAGIACDVKVIQTDPCDQYLSGSHQKHVLLQKIKINQSNSLHSMTFRNIAVRPGDHARFLTTPGNSVRLGRSGEQATQNTGPNELRKVMGIISLEFMGSASMHMVGSQWGELLVCRERRERKI